MLSSLWFFGLWLSWGFCVTAKPHLPIGTWLTARLQEKPLPLGGSRGREMGDLATQMLTAGSAAPALILIYI